MTAWSSDFYAITPRSQSSICNAIQTWTIKTQKRVDVFGPTPFREKVTNAAQVSLTLFSDRSHKQNGAFDRYSLRLHCLGDCDQGGESATIVSDSRRKQFVVTPDDCEVRVFCKDCIEVRANDHQRRSRRAL